MSAQLPVQSSELSTVGKDVVKLLIREPVKEAVQEALREEQMREPAYTDRSSKGGADLSDSDDGGRGVPSKSILAVVGLTVAILAIRRMRSGDGTGDMAGQHEQRQHTATQSERNSSSHMSEDGD